MGAFRVGAAVVLAAVAWLLLAPVPLGGGAMYVTARGDSMHPAFADGDLVVIRPAAAYAIGDTVAYRSEQLGSVVLHRIVAVADDGYVTRGDNNRWRDPERPTRADVIGSARLRIPGGGAALRVVSHPSALAAGAFVVVASGGAGMHRRRRRGTSTMRTAMTPTERPLARLRSAAFPGNLRSVAGGVAAVALAGGMLAGLAWTRPVERTITTENTVTTAVDFSYRAEVAESAAYDGTVVAPPDPLFRSLADTVEVTYQYDGPPATVAVDAELATASGWRSMLRLAEPTTVGRRAQGAVRLDLAAIQHRADAAAAVIGLPATQIEVTVIPRVTLEGGKHFEPRLPFVLDEHALRLRDVAALSVEDTTTVPRTDRVAATLPVLGRDVPVATLRTVSAAVLILALIAFAGVAVAVRGERGVEEIERIRRRYGRLILPVLPVALPPGRPVVDVPELESLVMLAERFGLMVLHWRRSDVDTYVVQDEQTTYRYRAGARHPIGASGPAPAADGSVVAD